MGLIKFTTLLKNLLGKLSEDDGEVDLVSDLIIPKKEEVPDDQKFVSNFIEYGGRFLYCENESEALEELYRILDYEKIETLVCFDEELKTKIKTLPKPFHISENVKEGNLSFIKCEYLVAFDGSIMVSSTHTGKHKPFEMPKRYVIYATPKQITKNISRALELLKKNHSGDIPTNISCIRKDIHAINNLSSPDEIYLLLVEKNSNE